MTGLLRATAGPSALAAALASIAPAHAAPQAAVTGSAQEAPQPEPAEDPPAAEAADIIVTGSRLTTGGYAAPTPVTVVSSDFLAQRAPTTVGDTLAEIPSFRPTGGLSQGTAGTFATGQATLDLRGLGTTRTLVLVNGLRNVPNQATGALDTNLIPVGLIDTVDVVTGGASAAYGSDAVAGVVNFVLNERLNGIKATVQQGVTQNGDNYEFTVNLAGGASFAQDRGHIIWGGDYSDSDGSGTMYSRDWGRREAGAVRLGARAAALPAILVADQNHLTIAPGGLVTGCVQRGVTVTGAACAVGNLTFDDAGNPRPFVFGSIVGPTQQVGGEGYNQFRNQLLRVGGRRVNGLARVAYDLTDAVSVFAQASFGRFQVRARTIDYLNTNIVINRDNPFIPASLANQMDSNGITQLRMNKLNFAQQGGREPRNVNDFWQAVGGVKGTVFGDWKWDASYLHGVGRTQYRITGLVLLPNYYASLYSVRGPGGTPVCGPIASNPMFGFLSPAQRALVTAGCVPMNPFGTNSQSDQAFDYVSPDVEQLTRFKRQNAAVNLSGTPFATWAGDVAIAVGGEWRRDQVDVTTDAVTAARSRVSAFDAANPQPGSGRVSVKEAYGEIAVPLARDVTLLRSLDINAAARVTDYSSSGTVTTWKVGGTWEPFDFLRLRGTRSRDIRAPNIPELFYRGNEALTTGANPLTGRSNTINTATLNNPGLRPEKADTWTVGLVVQPQWAFARGLRASFDYFDIRLNDVITTIPALEVLNRFYVRGQTEFGQFIEFDANQASGFSRVNLPLLNLNRQETRGFDVAMNYASDLAPIGLPGRLSIGIQGTRLYQLETFDAAGVSLGDIAGAVPKWRVNTTLGYAAGGFNATVTGRYNSPLTYNVTFVDPDSPGYVSTAPNSISDNVFPAAAFFSLNLSYDVVNRGTTKATMFVLIDNLFDKDPPAAAFQLLSGIGNNPSSSFNPYDLLGRSFKVGLRLGL